MNNTSGNTTRRISSLEEHRALLRSVISSAKERIIIVSPFISSKALTSDYLPSQIKTAVARGVKVQIFTDDKLNCEDSGNLKKSASDGIYDLTRSGAQVKIISGIHNKTLIMDDCLLAEGSFNWLSAVRIKGGENQREERTMIAEGTQAKGMIDQEVAQLLNHKSSNEMGNTSKATTQQESLGGVFARAAGAFIGMPILAALLGAGAGWGIFPGIIVAAIIVYRGLNNKPTEWPDYKSYATTPLTNQELEHEESMVMAGARKSVTEAGYIGLFADRKNY